MLSDNGASIETDSDRSARSNECATNAARKRDQRSTDRTRTRDGLRAVPHFDVEPRPK